MRRLAALRSLLRRDVVAICIVIFTADIMSGILSPTFSLHARKLGASLTMIGALSSTVGLTKLFISMPMGVISDRVGRKTVLTAGMALFSVAAVSFALAPNAYWLFLGRMLSGIAMVCTFLLGVAYVGDIVRPEERGWAFGLYSTSMGLGFTIGPLIGAAVAVRYGVPASYLVAAVATMAGAIVAARTLKDVRPAMDESRGRGQLQRRSTMGALSMLRDRNLLAGSLGNLMMNVSFGGAIVNFFPIYAAQLLVAQAAINSMFSVRAFGSTLARLPTGVITSRVPSRVVMYVALMMSMAVLFLMSNSASPTTLALLLLLEGIAFGGFLTSGQVFVAENCTAATRGAAVGAFSTAGSFGSILSPIALGLAADLWGVQMVFRLTSLLVLASLLVIGYLNMHPAVRLVVERVASEGE